MSNSYDWDYDAMVPGGMYDAAANETWLEEMAGKGYHISKIVGSRVWFKKGEPQVVRYRLQPMRKKKEKLDEERISLYREMGWEYLGTVSGVFHLWRCGDDKAPELDTDPVVQADGYRYLKRGMGRMVAVNILLIVFLAAVYFFAFMTGSTGLRNTLRDTILLERLTWVIAMVCGLIYGLMDIRTMGRLLKRLEAGIPPQRPAPYRVKQWLQRGVVVGIILYYILYSVSFFWPAGNNEIKGWSAMAADGTPKAGIIYLDMEDMAERGEKIKFYSSIQKVHELAPSITQVEMAASPDGIVRSVDTADTTHYRLLTKALAPALVEDIQHTYRNWGPFEEVETEGLDRFLVSHRKETQVVIAARGNEVLEVFYSGKTDLAAQGAYFARLLDSTQR